MSEILKIKVIKEIVNGITVFSGWIEGKKVRDVAKIVHISRDGEYVQGYQRSELPKHIESITDYVESKNSTILANLVIGFNKTVHFEPLELGSEFGYLHVPYDPEMPSSMLPGAIVDGQQRSGGVKNSHHDSYPLPVSIFISENELDYIQQFLILNLGKPLTSVQLNALALYDIYKPPALEDKAFPLSISEELGYKRPDSPLLHLIKSNGNKEGVIAESSITEFISNIERRTIKTLFENESLAEKEERGFNIRVRQDFDKKARDKFIDVIINFWSAVSQVFSEDWTMATNKKKGMKCTYLLHGTSVIGLSYLCRHMLRLYTEPQHNRSYYLPGFESTPSVEFFAQELNLIKNHCHFSKGYWTLGLTNSPEHASIPYTRKWNDFQNTTSEKQLFATNLLRIYEIQKGLRDEYPIYIK